VISQPSTMLAPEEADPTRRASNEQPSEDVMSIIQVRAGGSTDQLACWGVVYQSID